MNLIHYEPLAAMRRFQREFDHLLTSRPTDSTRSLWVPAVDIEERENAFVLSADLPGIDPKDIEITTEKDALIVRGERLLEQADGDDAYRRSERYSGKFERRFSLPDTADADAIGATSNHGVLTITIPKKAKLLPKRIAVQAD